ncbi:amyloid-beta A4 precursor protein-binding family A member 2 isoform X2 [Denticeps clupeoides]|uniref:amyloid-beta A4 precursor protein-binding family A member 2 isoform X2 n=1 Tax=Denticeps clupeoides TaxID=299321 RepID=UPI0010A3C4C0|nr:amyloid-beta A4 precursor protein-binding family A member 2-like isoform X2 [Denticeps clupeoides]
MKPAMAHRKKPRSKTSNMEPEPPSNTPTLDPQEAEKGQKLEKEGESPARSKTATGSTVDSTPSNAMSNNHRPESSGGGANENVPIHPDSMEEDSLSDYDNVGSEDEERDCDEDEELRTDADGMTYYVHCCPEDESYMEGMDCHEGGESSDGPSTSRGPEPSCKPGKSWENSEGFYEVLQHDAETLVYKRPESITDPAFLQAPMAEDEEDEEEEEVEEEEDDYFLYEGEEAEEDQDGRNCRGDSGTPEDSRHFREGSTSSCNSSCVEGEGNQTFQQDDRNCSTKQPYSQQNTENKEDMEDNEPSCSKNSLKDSKGSKTGSCYRRDEWGDGKCSRGGSRVRTHDKQDSWHHAQRHSRIRHRDETPEEGHRDDVPEDCRDPGLGCGNGGRGTRNGEREVRGLEAARLSNEVKRKLSVSKDVNSVEKPQELMETSRSSCHTSHRRESGDRPPSIPLEQPDVPQQASASVQSDTKDERRRTIQEHVSGGRVEGPVAPEESPQQINPEPRSEPPSRNHRPQKKNASFPSFVDVSGPCEPEDLVDGIIFAANYLGSTQLLSDRNPSKNIRMMQAQEALDRVKSLDEDSQALTEVDLFVSTKAIKVLNADTQETMMDNALRTISYIADIGSVVVLMARRRMSHSASLDCTESGNAAGEGRKQYRIICYVFESEDAQLIAQSIGQAFSMAYQEFLRANGINPKDLSQKDYSDIIHTQEMYNDDLIHFSNSDNCKEVQVEKQKGEILGVVIVESGWGSILPTVILACMLNSGPAARSGKLNVGDQIMAVNDTSLVGLPLATCQGIIKGLKNLVQVKLSVVSCPPVTTVLIKRPDLQYQLGFSVQNGIICSLMRGGIAERGGVRVGHRIIEINGQSVVAMAHEKIVHALSVSVGEINMKTMPAVMFRLLTGQETPVYI